MKNRKPRIEMVLVILVALLIGLALGRGYDTKVVGESTTPSSAHSATQPAVQKWEYKVIHLTRDEAEKFNPAFNKVGEEGWEYVGIVCNNGVNAHYVAFKRPKQ
jgi:hypothetical protein